MVTRMARIPALTPAAEQSTTDGPTTLMVKQRQEVAEQLSEAFSSEAATDFVSWCTRREASTGLVLAFFDFVFERFEAIVDGIDENLDQAVLMKNKLDYLSKMQGAAGQFVAWGLDHFKGKTDPTGAVRALGSYRLAQATLRRLQVRMIDILVNDHDAIDEVVDRDLREMLKSADKDLKHLFGKRAALEPETVMREVDDWKARRAELEEHELKIPASKTTTTSLKKDKSLFSLELGILHAFIANPKLTDANGRPARAIHATRTNRAGGASKLEEEEYFQPPTLPALTDLSTRSRSEGSVPSPPAQEGSSAHLRPADGSSQAVASERTSRLSITPIPPSSMTPRKRRRSTRATASRHDSEDEDEQRMGDVTITPASTPRNKGKGRARVDATTSTTYSFVIDSLVPFKREDSSPLLDADFPSTRIDPIRIKKTTTTIAAATSHPIVTIGSRESSRLSSVSSLESGVSDQIEQDLVLTSSASGSSGSSSAVPLAQATFGPLSSSLRGSTTTKAAPVKKSPPTATTTRPRKKRKSGTPWDKAKPKKKLKKGGRKAMAADANVTKVEEGAEETDEGEESLPEDFEEGQNDVYVVGSIEERRKRRGVWEFKVRWQNYGPEEDTWEPLRNVEGTTALKVYLEGSGKK